MRLIVTATLLALCDSVAAVADSALLSQLRPGERVHISYHSRGCFHDRSYEFDFERKGSVTVRSSGHVVPLTSQEIAGLDKLIAFYRSRPGGGCTTQGEIVISDFRDRQQISSEHYVDGSCATYEMKDITRFYEIAKKLGLDVDSG
jgi:hypothetical protein